MISADQMNILCNELIQKDKDIANGKADKAYEIMETRMMNGAQKNPYRKYAKFDLRSDERLIPILTNAKDVVEIIIARFKSNGFKVETTGDRSNGIATITISWGEK